MTTTLYTVPPITLWSVKGYTFTQSGTVVDDQDLWAVRSAALSANVILNSTPGGAPQLVQVPSYYSGATGAPVNDTLPVGTEVTDSLGVPYKKHTDGTWVAIGSGGSGTTAAPTTLDALTNVDITTAIATPNPTVLSQDVDGTWRRQTLNLILPPTAGNAGKMLMTDGANVFWGIPATQTVAPNLTGTAGDTTATLTWTKVAGTGYQLQRDSVTIYTGLNATFTDTGLTNGTAHVYKVAAIVTSGQPGPYSNSVQLTPASSGSTVQTLTYTFTASDGTALDATKLIKSTAYANTAPTGAKILGGQGKFITNTIGNYDVNDRVAYSANLAACTEQEVVVDMTLTSGEIYPGVQLRSDADANANGYSFEFTSSGLELTRIQSYTRVSKATSTAVTATAGTPYRGRFKIAGTTVTGRVWRVADTEPTSWQVSFTETAPLPAGLICLFCFPGNTAVASSTQGVSFDNLTITADGFAAPGTPTGGGGPPATTGQVFAASSFWYDDISGAPLASNSAAIASDAVRQMKQYYGTSSRTNVQLNTTDYAAPVYLASGTDPLVTFGFNDCQSKGYFDSGLRAQFTGVPIPANTQPADGTDQEMVIWQQSTDKMWETWVTVHSGSSWSACWGGRMDNVSTSNGIWQGGYGTTATGLPFLGGQISMAEMTAAMAGTANAIPHAIGIAFVETKAGHGWPAQRDDGGYGNSPIMEGMRLRINPSLNIAALGLNPIAKAIALAGQKYGFVVWDKAGAVSLRCENPKSRTVNGGANPYPGWFSTAGVQDYNALDGVPWASLQALPLNYGQR